MIFELHCICYKKTIWKLEMIKIIIRELQKTNEISSESLFTRHWGDIVVNFNIRLVGRGLGDTVWKF